jgi:hypothetical protein
MRTRISLPSALRTQVRPLSLLAPAFLLLSTAAALRAQTPNPAAYLTFDEGSGTVAHDSSGNNNDATLLGGAGWPAGLVGPGALNLTGAAGAYADIPRDVVDTTKSLTVAAWVKLNSLGGFQTFVSEDSGFQKPPSSCKSVATPTRSPSPSRLAPPADPALPFTPTLG